MFALIETKGASHIAIHIPGNAAADSLPALAAMLENNAVFVKIGWREIDIVTPDMSIILGNKYTVKDTEGVKLTVAESGAVISTDFVIATPEAFLDNRKVLAKKEEENSRLRKELEYKNSELSTLKEKIESLTREEE